MTQKICFSSISTLVNFFDDFKQNPEKNIFLIDPTTLTRSRPKNSPFVKIFLSDPYKEPNNIVTTSWITRVRLSINM
jgi:hypothetical protein